MISSIQSRPGVRLVIAVLAAVVMCAVVGGSLTQFGHRRAGLTVAGTCYEDVITAAGHSETITVCPPIVGIR